jgi:exodeoxyribonuclease VII large subunit
LRVSQLNRLVRTTLESEWPSVWVEGELRDVSYAGSGHVYFTLCDEDEPAQVRGVMFRNDARRSKAKLEDGARVKMRGGLSLFEPRGSYQLIVRVALPYGLGDLSAQIEAVRLKLEAEGLFAPERKRALPLLPRVLGVVTSEAGAALHDVIRVAHSRAAVRIVLSPCVVQGNDAPVSIVRALERIQRVPDLDVVIVGRGGGAAEDLIAFSDERVARAIAACRVPTVSAVGHEVDVSIADYVADVRAATPSNAAELCVPDRRALLGTLEQAERSLSRALEVRLSRARLRLDRVANRVRDPRSALGELERRLLRAFHSLASYLRARLERSSEAHEKLIERLARRDPRLLLSRRAARLAALDLRLHAISPALLGRRKQALAERAARLDALSPLAVLARGYAIALHARTGRALLRASEIRTGESLRLRLHQGELLARVLPATGDRPEQLELSMDRREREEES